MSDSNDTPNDPSSTDRSWYGADENYPAGMIWEGSMFPPGRDESIYGPQGPLEVVGPAGPFDAEHGDQSWRVTNGGRHIFTGEAHVRSRRPDDQQQEYQTRFWEKYNARAEEASVQDQVHEDAGNTQFSDSFPTDPSPHAVPGPTRTNTAQHSTPSGLQLIQAAPPRSAGVLDYLYANGFLQAQQGPAPVPVPTSAPTVLPSSDIDGEYEVDDDYLPDAPQAQPIATDNDDHEQLPDSTPPKTSSPRGVDDWDDDNLLSFWKFKVIRKKGYEPMLVHFPGQTTESLHKTWKAHKQRCEELGAAWRAARKPAGPVSEWLNE